MDTNKNESCYFVEKSKTQMEKIKGIGLCIAKRDICKGEIILIEEPLCLIQHASYTKHKLPESSSSEWHLTLELLKIGKRKKWAKNFIHKINPMNGEPEEIIQKIIEEVPAGCSEEDVKLIYRAVCCNAFSWQTTVLNIDVGIAFYEKAAMFNHSCSPNCLSIRTNGIMRIYATQTITKGTELCHSYVDLFWLLGSRIQRQNYIPFECFCDKCVNETENDEKTLLSLSFPPNHANTELGQKVGKFKINGVIGNNKSILNSGDEMFSSNITFFLEHPIAFIEVFIPYFNSFWQSFPNPPQIKYISDLTWLYYISIQKLSELSYHINNKQIFNHLFGVSSILLYLFQGHLYSTVSKLFIKGLINLKEIYGENFVDLSLNEDLSFISYFSQTVKYPKFKLFSEIIENTKKNKDLNNLIQISSLKIDHCSEISCLKLENQNNTQFLRCSKCKRVKYCSQEHQVKHWSIHKHFCMFT